jgi:deoxyribonuclease-4
VGFERLAVLHGNDSKRPCGSRIDRHEHIGQGCLGFEPFRRLFQDRRMEGRPILIETEKTPDANCGNRIDTDPLDVRNLDTLRRLRQEAAGD